MKRRINLLSLDACDKPNDTAIDEIRIREKSRQKSIAVSPSLSIEHSEKQPPHNQPKRHDSSREAEDKLKLDTHDTLLSSNDPAGLFLNNSVNSMPLNPPIPAVDAHILLKSGKRRKNKFCHDHHNCTTCKYNDAMYTCCVVCMTHECCYERK